MNFIYITFLILASRVEYLENTKVYLRTAQCQRKETDFVLRREIEAVGRHGGVQSNVVIYIHVCPWVKPFKRSHNWKTDKFRLPTYDKLIWYHLRTNIIVFGWASD